jgi:serine O-acetyltransferase
LALFRQDAARWVEPQSVVPVERITPAVALKLLLRHPPLRAMAWFRLASLAKRAGVRGVPSWVQRRLLRLYGLELTPGTEIGGGLYIAHPVGCVLVAESIGENVSVIAQVTFGTRADSRWPTIGEGVFVGAGARVLGGITVGANASIGANAVVVHDVAPGVTVVGVPAHPIETGSRKSS